MTKTSQNNLNYINFLKHFYEYHTEKLKYRDVTCLILKVLPWWICYYCFCSQIQSIVELESVIVATAPYFEHTAPLNYSLCLSSAFCCNRKFWASAWESLFSNWRILAPLSLSFTWSPTICLQINKLWVFKILLKEAMSYDTRTSLLRSPCMIQSCA